MSIRAKRGTKAQVDAAAVSSGLKQSEIVYLTDKGDLAVATSASSYVVLARLDDTLMDIFITGNA